MKKLILFLIITISLMISSVGYCQFNFKKVKFQEIINENGFNNLLIKSKAENKYSLIVFIYSSRDKYLESMIKELELRFEKDAIANFINEKFNCALVKYQFSSEWQQQNLYLFKFIQGCKIRGSPNIVYINAKGKVVHKGFLSYYNDSLFMKELNQALDSNYQCFSLLEKFNSGIRDSFTTKQLFKQLSSVYDSTDDYVLEFINSQNNIYTSTNAEILLNSGSEIAAFNHFYKNHEKWLKFCSEKTLDSFYRKSIYNIISNSYYFIYRLNLTTENLIATFENRYPKYGRLQTILFLATQNKNNFLSTLNSYDEIIYNYCDFDIMKELSANEMNSIAWQIFQNSDAKNSLNIAVNFSNQSLVINKDNPMYLDTYANILYKLGKTVKAIEIETKALELIEEKKKKSYQETLDKMKQGKPTWK